MKFLCIDVGYVSPGFSIITHETNSETIDIEFFVSINFKLPNNSINWKSMNECLNYFCSLKIDNVIIEKQMTDKNKNIASYMNGFFNAKGINTIIRNPISCLRKKKDSDTRKDRKGFSVDLVNSFFNKNMLKKKLLKKDCDLADSVNLGLLFIHKEILKNKTDFSDFDLRINNVYFKTLVMK